MSDIYRHRYDTTGTVLRRRQTQPNERALLERNAKLRREGGLADLTFAGDQMRIPEIAYYALQKKYPDLASPDGQTRTKAWKKFYASSEADPYRTHDRRGHRGNAPVSNRPSTANRDL